MMNEIYPLTVVLDRYNGTYSYGKWTAWNLDFDCVPRGIASDDFSCFAFWENQRRMEDLRKECFYIGIGDTPNEAIENLELKLRVAAGEFVPEDNNTMPF